jgi:hypothetical protein
MARQGGARLAVQQRLQRLRQQGSSGGRITSAAPAMPPSSAIQPA